MIASIPMAATCAHVQLDTTLLLMAMLAMVTLYKYIHVRTYVHTYKYTETVCVLLYDDSNNDHNNKVSTMLFSKINSDLMH